MSEPLPTLRPRRQRYEFLNYADVAYGYEATVLLLAVSGPNPEQDVKDAWTKFGYPKAKFFLFESTPEIPTAVCVDAGNLIWIGINGTDNISQVINYTKPTALYASHKRGSQRISYNGTFDAWGRKVYEQLSSYLDGRKPRVAFHGHSYGGAVALAAATYWVPKANDFSTTVVTFGSPKVGNELYYEPIDHTLICRWMNAGDPVPALPPSDGEIGEPLSLVQGLIARFFVPQITQPPGGRILDSLGRYIAGHSTTLTPNVIKLLTLDDDSSFDPRRFTYHYLTTYRDRLLLAAVREYAEEGINFHLPLYDEVKKSGIPIRPPALWPPIKLRSRVELMSIIQKERENMIEPTPSPYVPKACRAFAQKYGLDQYQCSWMGETIATDKARTKCHSIAKALNKFLRRSLVTGEVGATSFRDALDAFIAQATVGGVGFRPDVANWTGM